MSGAREFSTENQIEWVFSSVGRASPLQGEGRGFKSLNTHHLEETLMGFFFVVYILLAKIYLGVLILQTGVKYHANNQN